MCFSLTEGLSIPRFYSGKVDKRETAFQQDTDQNGNNVYYLKKEENTIVN